MTLLKRIGYYLGGFSIGLVILAFFLNGKKVSCDYSPSARVKKNIGIKNRVFSNEVENMITNKLIDTAIISNIIKYGDVNFSKSNTKLDSCRIYVLEGTSKKKDYVLVIENCSENATIQKVDIKNKAQ